jgi:hypothetical protein
MIPNGFGKVYNWFSELLFVLAPHEMRIYPERCFGPTYRSYMNQEEEYIAAYVLQQLVILQSFD